MDSTRNRPQSSSAVLSRKCAAFSLAMISSSVIIVMATMVCKAYNL
jgi:heme O synthase-like polyprenyltransferase